MQHCGGASAAGSGERGHRVVFFERDVPYYSSTRDAAEFSGCDLRLYENWNVGSGRGAARTLRCRRGMVTSYCPDGAAACDLVLS